MPQPDFRIVGHGSDLAIEMRGAELEDCLAAGVAGFAATLGDVTGEAARGQHAVAVRADRPSGLLVELFEELVTLVDVDGVLPVDLSELRLAEDGWDAVLETVPLDRVVVHGTAPKAATWHRARLRETDQGWEGYVTLDL